MEETTSSKQKGAGSVPLSAAMELVPLSAALELIGAVLRLPLGS